MSIRVWVPVLALGLAGCGDDETGDGGGSGTSAGSTTAPTSTTAGTTTVTTTSAGTTSAGTTTDGTTSMGSTGGSSGSTGGMFACPYTEVAGDPQMGFEVVASGFNQPVFVLGDPSEPQRLFVVEKNGTIRILEPGENTAPGGAAWLTVSPRTGGEQGLLGFAFHPNYPTDPRVYVDYIPSGGNARTRIEEYTVANDVPGSARTVLEFDQPAGNHNGGSIAFGPDGFLYIGAGDGGGANDQFGNGQNLNTMLGSILRIGVDPGGGMQYTIPGDNPFIGMGRGEIYAYGMRNPWRFSFDPQNGDLYVADVGQGRREEVTIVGSGENHGWNTMEGTLCFSPMNGCNMNGLTLPLTEYDHGGGRCSITGGANYRGCEVPGWSGRYIYADFCSNQVWSVENNGGAAQNEMEIDSIPGGPAGNGWNALGDVYITSFNGNIYRLAPS